MEVIQPTQPTPASGMRSKFLTVLCILTFLGSGWGVIKSFRSYMMADTVSSVASEAMSEAEDKMDNDDTPGFVKNIFDSVNDRLTPENIRKTSIMQFVSNLLTLFGAILMWNLNRTGFYLYIIGVLVEVVMPMFIFGKGLLGGISSAMVGFFGVIFIVMYAVNLKYMRK